MVFFLVAVPQIVFMQYGNITEGQISPEAFQLPTYCNQAQEGHDGLQAYVTETLIRPFM